MSEQEKPPVSTPDTPAGSPADPSQAPPTGPLAEGSSEGQSEVPQPSLGSGEASVEWVERDASAESAGPSAPGLGKTDQTAKASETGLMDWLSAREKRKLAEAKAQEATGTRRVVTETINRMEKNDSSNHRKADNSSHRKADSASRSDHKTNRDAKRNDATNRQIKAGTQTARTEKDQRDRESEDKKTRAITEKRQDPEVKKSHQSTEKRQDPDVKKSRQEKDEKTARDDAKHDRRTTDGHQVAEKRTTTDEKKTPQEQSAATTPKDGTSAKGAQGSPKNTGSKASREESAAASAKGGAQGEPEGANAKSPEGSTARKPGEAGGPGEVPAMPTVSPQRRRQNVRNRTDGYRVGSAAAKAAEPVRHVVDGIKDGWADASQPYKEERDRMTDTNKKAKAGTEAKTAATAEAQTAAEAKATPPPASAPSVPKVEGKGRDGTVTFAVAGGGSKTMTWGEVATAKALERQLEQSVGALTTMSEEVRHRADGMTGAAQVFADVAAAVQALETGGETPAAAAQIAEAVAVQAQALRELADHLARLTEAASTTLAGAKARDEHVGRAVVDSGLIQPGDKAYYL